MKQLWTLVFTQFVFLASSLAASVTQELPKHSQINWTQKTITVTGSAAPSLKAKNAAQARLGAERAAKLDAYRNILEAVKGATLTGATTAGEIMAKDAGLKAQVEGLVKNFTVVKTKYYSDGGVDVVVSVPLGSVVAQLVKGSDTAAAENKSEHTGLIIDARGTKLQPALNPRILNESGDILFAGSTVGSSQLAESGVAAYVKSMRDARKHKHVDKKPLTVKPIRVAGTDIVVSSKDQPQIAAISLALSQGRVVFLVD